MDKPDLQEKIAKKSSDKIKPELLNFAQNCRFESILQNV